MAFMNAQRHQTTQAAPALSRLPVPDLHKTLEKYLKSLEPYIREDEARGGLSFESAYNTRLSWIKDFESGIGNVCQERLLDLDKRSPNNWLDDNFWLKLVYHSWRAPLLINSNWWLAFHNDNTVPDAVIRADVTGYTSWQIRRAAWLVYRTLDFRERLKSQELYPDTTRTGIWFRSAALKMFNISRIPQENCDKFSPLPSPKSLKARSIVVMAKDWFYAVEVLDESENPLPVSEIERRLRAVIADVKTRLEKGEAAVPVGVLTTDERERWTENLRHLLSLSPQNQKILKTINESIFALCLDDYTYVLPADIASSHSNFVNTTSATPSEVTAHLHNIRSGHSARPGHNRWYDKALNIIVESNSRAGALGEHSPCDALVPSIVMEYAVVQNVIEGEFEGDVESPQVATQGWQKLDWATDAMIAKECVEAEKRAKVLVDDSDDDVLWFDVYGSDWIKNKARLSPDAYIQIALQLAWYRTRGEFTAVYETALTRLFHNGRTETIRSFTNDSRAFVLSMADKTSTAQTRFALLRRAVQTHTALTREAATGRGIDRHLLGLQQMLPRGESHALFNDELFTQSQTWKLSTSGLSAGPYFHGTGFGTPYPDGYGINYMIGPELIKFGIESKHSSSKTSTKQFITIITQALLDLQSICVFGLESHL